MDDLNYPDVFADGFAINTHEYGCAMTFRLTSFGADGQVEDRRVVARIRLTPSLASALENALGSSLRELESGATLDAQEPDSDD